MVGASGSKARRDRAARSRSRCRYGRPRRCAMSDLILIVEDNDKNLKLTRDLLRFHGFETIEATNAEDGIALAQDRKPDLVLMDIQLPGMDGVSALRELRRDTTT